MRRFAVFTSIAVIGLMLAFSVGGVSAIGNVAQHNPAANYFKKDKDKEDNGNGNGNGNGGSSDEQHGNDGQGNGNSSDEQHGNNGQGNGNASNDDSGNGNGNGNSDNGNGNGNDGHGSDATKTNDDSTDDSGNGNSHGNDDQGQGNNGSSDNGSNDHGNSGDKSDKANKSDKGDDTSNDSGTPEAKHGSKKILVCHVTGLDDYHYNLIEISKHAWPAHERHGDFLAPDGATSSTDCESAANEGTLAASPEPSGTPEGSPETVDLKLRVCHITSSAKNPVILISISQHAWPAHEAHGDFLAPDDARSSNDCELDLGSPVASPEASPDTTLGG